LERSYARVNRYFTIIVFITAIIGASTDTIVYNKHNFHFLFTINLILTTILLADLWLLLTKKLSLRTAFILLLYTTLINITLTHIHEFQYDNFYAKAILIGFWGLLFVVLSGMVLGGWHPYVVMLWANMLLVYDITRTGPGFLVEVIPIIIVTLAGLSYGISMYMKLLRNSFQKNQDILDEVTSQKNIVEKQARELEKINTNLNELQQLQNDLIDMIVHDMKNPLNSIINNSSKKPSGKEYAYIHEAGRQILVLVENMLDVQKMENTVIQYNIEALNVSGILQDAMFQIELLTRQHAVKIETEVDKNLYVLADREILVRIFVNLFTNAIKHSPERSCVKVYCRQNGNQEVIVSIKDRGEGIPDEYRYKVFEKFVQVVSRKSGSARSTGLGLSFCKMTIEFMKGKIWIEDTSKEGTTISFSLPVAKSSEGINSVIYKSAEKTILSDEDIQFLSPLICKLKKLDVYKGGQILQEFTTLPALNKNVENWIEEVKMTVYSVNQEHYKEMLELVISNVK
ncbi:MAG TPA: HAMP domain-containing sensor histidine kinase, partial [Anaerovoracaceae bacterium]|nr:HAMP domain-containing sensor histidine kinase [Anaerovoracaceae bacterium]